MMREAFHHRRSDRRGYVLVMTLALLVVSTSVMVGVARLAIRQTTLARQAGEDLQQRWGVASIRLAALPGSEKILDAAEATLKRPAPVLAASVTLGGQTFDIVISDEQAKANVNAMLDRSTNRATANAHVETRLRELIGGKLSGRLRLRPEPLARRASTSRPATQPSSQPVLPQAISGFGQIFDNLPPQELMNMRSAAISPAALLTCWGGGAINIRRAPEASLKLMLSPPLSSLEISRLLDARGAMFKPEKSIGPPLQPLSRPQPRAPLPTDPVRRLLAQGNIPPATASRMTLSSSCHSLWIVAQSQGRQWYYFWVRDESDPTQPRTVSMRW